MKKIWKYRFYYYLALPGLIYFIIFHYVPMGGALIAFKDISPFDGLRGFFDAPWVGFKHFERFTSSVYFLDVIENTLIISGLKILAGATLMDVSVKENGESFRQPLTESFQSTWGISYELTSIGLAIDYTGNLYGPMRLPLLGKLDPRPEYSPWWSIQNIQLTKTFSNQWEIYGGVKNLLDFTPDSNSIARPYDPFDQNVVF